MGKRKFVAITCSHGLHLSKSVEDELHVFLADFKPDLRVHLGDIWDTTAWRGGASGTADEGADINEDFNAGANHLRRYEPHLVFLGNHDIRPYNYLNHTKAIIKKAANDCVREMEKLIQVELKAELVPYNVFEGWRMIGDTAFGHGYMYNVGAVRATVEMLCGRPVIMGHVHTLQAHPGLCLGAPTGHSAGLMADIKSLKYAQARRSTTGWKNGWVYGYYDDHRTDTMHYPSRTGMGRDIPTALAASGTDVPAAGSHHSGGVCPGCECECEDSREGPERDDRVGTGEEDLCLRQQP
jgi:hypothetical protein